MSEIRPRHIRIPLQFALLVAGFVVLVTMSLTSLWLARESETAAEEVAQALEVNNAIVVFQGAVRRAESGQRGFLLTGDPSYLKDYEIGLARMREIRPELERLIADNPAQQAKFAALQPALEARLLELTETVRLMASGRNEEALTLARSGQGLALMNQVLGQILAMIADERALLGVRQEYADRTNLLLFIVNFAGGLIIAVLALASISLIRKRNLELAQAHTELAEANATLAKTNAQLEQRVAERTADLREANEEVQRFAFIVSHDLRSPLVNIMGFTSELSALQEEIFADRSGGDPAKREEQRKEFNEALGFIKTSIAKMDRLINAILQLSRAGRREFTSQPVDLTTLMKGLANDIAHRALEANATIEISELPVVSSDRLALEQVFSNLLDNAIKYLRTDIPGHIDVTGEIRAGLVHIQVSDNGRGIEPKDHERIFELFRRAGTQDRPGEGIGLAHVRTLVRRIGGTIRIDSAANKGTTFTVILPKTWTAE